VPLPPAKLAYSFAARTAAAVVNDAAVANGGLTNLALKAAAPGFEKQKKLWLP